MFKIMITKFKLFERMGIDDLVIQIAEKVFKEFYKHFKEKKAFTNKEDNYCVDISEFKLEDEHFKQVCIRIDYNSSQSKSGFPISVGVIDSNEPDKIKTPQLIKGVIIHEMKHLLFAARKHGSYPGIKNKIYNDKNRFIRGNFMKDIFLPFEDVDSNVHGMKVTIPNFLKYDGFTEQYKKLLVYLYYANQDELSARTHEFYDKVKGTNKFKEVLEIEKTKQTLIGYTEMINFKIDMNNFSNNEKKRCLRLFDPKNVKKVEKYIQTQGQKFINKIHKLSYFQDSEK